ncbi:MAG: carbon-nitrogen hydrolase family protein [Phycisphaerae bacterium]|nr:carbon-nitrogen hydrolase family protein [Phycisphaerae bacterium]
MRIALAQMRIETGRKSANMVRALSLIDKACDMEPAPDLVVLPECCDLGNLSAESADLVEPVGGTFAESLAAKAREMGVHVLAGLAERHGQAVYSAAVLFDVDGDVLLRQRGISIDSAADGGVVPGDRIQVKRTPFGTLGVQLSADLALDCITKCLRMMGASIVLAPCAWACEPGHEAEQLQRVQGCLARHAGSTGLSIVCVNGVGECDDATASSTVRRYGASLAYGPDGQALLVGPLNEEALLAVDLSSQAETSGGTRVSRGK